MNIVIDIHHPAHVHKFNFLIKELEKRHDIFVIAIEKEIVKYLLTYYKINYFLLGKNQKTLLKKLYYTIKYEIILIFKLKKFKPDIFIGGGELLMALASFILNKPYIVFDDSEHNKLTIKSYKPFADVILTPDCFRSDFGKKHVRYNGYHELAYLHPNYFKPDQSVIKDLGLNKNDKYFMIRKTSEKAVENIGQKLMNNSELIVLIEHLKKKGRVFLSAESKLDNKLEKYLIKIKPEKMHSFLFYAQMLVGDTLTMFTEAAILGTPAISISSEGFLLGNFDEICDKYKLGYRYKNLYEAMKKIEELIEKKDLKEEWKKKRERLLAEKIDVTKYWINFIENYYENHIK